MKNSTKSNNVTFLTWDEFKEEMNINKASVVKNPNTGKLFVAYKDKRWKCQNDIDFEKDLAFLIENEDYDKACLVNVTSSDNTVYSFE
jgi:3'-phosphoadenosine 5'-phosphosulfate (PAPS) 3'-phosphatase